MQTAHLASSPAMSYNDQIAPRHLGLLGMPKKRLRNETESLEPPRPSGKEGVRRQSNTLKTEASDLEFACPFYKHDPTNYGGCAVWSNPRIQTVTRHHVLGTHRKSNNKFGLIDDAVFDRVKALKLGDFKAKTHGWDEQKGAEELWKAVYTTLFHTEEDEAPNPYLGQEANGFTVDSIEELLKMHAVYGPNIVSEAKQCAHEIEQLKLERESKREIVNQTATAEEAALKSQLSDVRIRKLAEIRKIETEYYVLIEEKQLKLLEIIQSRPGSYTGARVSASQTSTFDCRARTEPLSSKTMDPFQLQSSNSHNASSEIGTQEVGSDQYFFQSIGNGPRFHQDELSSGLQGDLDLDWDSPLESTANWNQHLSPPS